MVQISISGGGQLKGTEADIIKSLIVNAEGLISIFHKLMNRQGGIVGFNNCVRYLRGGDYREGVHDTVGVLFTDLRD